MTQGNTKVIKAQVQPTQRRLPRENANCSCLLSVSDRAAVARPLLQTQEGNT